MPSITIDELLSSRPWEQALFTTYALSLTFFESIVLPFLRKQGCRDVWIVTDAEGYRASLMERRSGRVGQEYRLVPVALPRGVFHPKCTYLAGPEGDVLLVGSGNLTFGGYGKNLEVLDVLEPASAPATFEDFARFLDALGTRDGLLLPDRSWLANFAAQARTAARPFAEQPVEGQPRLVHTVRRSAVDQVAEVANANGGGRHLVVLSPFHDPDGAAVRELAERTGSSTIAVGLSPDDEDSSPFPFARAKSWKRSLRAVLPDLGDDDRCLHAKWIEIALPDKKLTLTGSINATTQSLCTTHNVEVGVLRIEPKSVAHVRWRDVAIPSAFYMPPARAPGLGHGCLVHASILDDGTLAGRLLALFDPSGVWDGKLLLGSGEIVPFSLTVGSSGDFRTSLPQSERFAFATALQVELTRGEHTARGWVQLDEILRMPRLHRIGVTSLLRLINREETEDDDVALLEYFAMSSSKHLTTFSRRINVVKQSEGTDADGEEAEFFVALDEIAPDSSSATAHEEASPEKNPSRADEAVLERVMAQLRRRLISQPTGRGSPAGELGSYARAGSEDDPEEDAGDTLRRRVESALEYFDEQMQSMAREADTAAARRSALVIWFEVSMHMLLRRLKDRGRAVGFLRDWFSLACAETEKTEAASALEQHVFTAAALLPFLAAPGADQSAMGASLHESLEHFVCGNVDEERAVAALLPDRQVGFMSLLLAGQAVDLRASLLAILRTRTRRRDLQDAMDAYRAGLPPDPKSPLFSAEQPYASALRSALSRRGTRPSIGELRGEDPVCAHCFVELHTRAAQDLEAWRVAQCTSCSRLTVRLKP